MNRRPEISATLMRKPDRSVVSMNERLVLDVVRRHDGISRSAITAHTQLTQQSVHRLVETLTVRGFLEVGQAVINGRGQPSKVITLNPQAVFSLGVSVNTDTIRLSIVDLECREVITETVPADPTDREASLAAIRSATEEVLSRNDIPGDRVLGMGVAVSGYKTPDPGEFVTPVPLEQWSNVPLPERFESVLGMPVWVENNATAGAIGESLVGAGRHHNCFAYLSFNYGFGGGFINDGQAILGGWGNAGELSHAYTAEQQIHRPALGELLQRLSEKGIHLKTIAELNARFDPNWPGVGEWIEEVGPQLNMIIRAISAVLDPTAVIFGGEAPAELRQLLIDACDPPEKDRYGRKRMLPQFIPSSIPGDPSTFGAAVIPLKDRVLI
jgi:predicted NBD/HSP70 family sugar kinase